MLFVDELHPGAGDLKRITEALIVLPGHLFLEMDVLLIKESKKPL